MRPPPVHVRINKPSNQWAHAGCEKRCGREQRHGMVHLFRPKQIPHRASRHTQEGTPTQSLEKARHDDRLDILGDSAGHDEDSKSGKGGQIDGPPTIELAEGRPHGPQRNAQHKRRQAQRGHELAAVEFGVHLRIRGRVNRRGACDAKGAGRGQGYNEPLARRAHVAWVPGVLGAAVELDFEGVLGWVGRGRGRRVGVVIVVGRQLVASVAIVGPHMGYAAQGAQRLVGLDPGHWGCCSGRASRWSDGFELGRVGIVVVVVVVVFVVMVCCHGAYIGGGATVIGNAIVLIRRRQRRRWSVCCSNRWDSCGSLLRIDLVDRLHAVQGQGSSS